MTDVYVIESHLLIRGGNRTSVIVEDSGEFTFEYSEWNFNHPEWNKCTKMRMRLPEAVKMIEKERAQPLGE
jgi:hypothetical protein